MFEKLIVQTQKAVTPEVITIGSNDYVSRAVVLPPAELEVKPLVTHTLQSIVDYVNSDFDGVSADLAIHVLSPTEVHLIDAVAGRHNLRNRWMVADCSGMCDRQFPFGQFMDIEAFIIKTQAFFVPSDVRSLLLSCVLSVEASEGLQADDDGISQVATVKKGVRLSQATIPNPVELKPYRTFSEINQPPSEFVFRIRKDEESIKAALFESGSARWELEAIGAIAQFLRVALNDVVIVA